MRKSIWNAALVLALILLFSGSSFASGQLLYPKFHGTDPNTGFPLVGGLLYTYKAGTTTTAKTTYSDRAMATPNANPVVLDAYGDAMIYAQGDLYLVLKTAAGATIWSLDNVQTVSTTVLKDADEYGCNLAAAVLDLGSTPTTLMIKCAITLTAGVTVPSTMSLWIMQGGSISGAYTLTINGQVLAGPYQIFGSTLTVAGSPKALPAYSEWFYTNPGTGDNGPAMTKCLAAFGRIDGVPKSTYTVKTDVAVWSWNTIDMHMATVNGDAGITEGIFSLHAGGTVNAVDGNPTTPVKNVTIQNINIDPKGAINGIYILGAAIVDINMVKWDNLDLTTNITGLLVRNSFGVTVRNCNFHGEMAAGTRGVHLSSYGDLPGYLVLNNIDIYESILQRSAYNLSMNFDEDTKGLSSHPFIFQGNAFLCGIAAGPAFFGYGVYVAAGGFFNMHFIGNKSEYCTAVFYTAPGVPTSSMSIRGHTSANARTLFDFYGLGSTEISQIRYTSGTGNATILPAGDWNVFKTVNPDVHISGAGFLSSDAGSHYTTNRIWPGGASDGNGSIVRDNEYYLPRTSNYTINAGDENIVLDNTGDNGNIVYTLPAITAHNMGFRVTILPSTESFSTTVTPVGTDIIRKYSISGSLICFGKGSPLRLRASPQGWRVVGDNIEGWRDVDAKIIDDDDHTTATAADLKSITLPANTLNRYSSLVLELAGTGAGNALDVTFGGTTITLTAAAADWSGEVTIDVESTTAQKLSYKSIAGAVAKAGYASPAEDVANPIILKIASTGSGNVAVRKWRLRWR
jgi:hypothetical protein